MHLSLSVSAHTVLSPTFISYSIISIFQFQYGKATTPYWIPNINGNSKEKTRNLSQQLLGRPSPLGSGIPPLQPLDYQWTISNGLLTTCSVASPLLCRCSYSEDGFLVPAVWLLCMRSKPPLHKPGGNIWSTDCEAPESEMFISWLAFIFFQLSKELWLKLTH